MRWLTMETEIEENALVLQRVLPPGMQPADGKAGVGISFAPDMEGYQIIQSMAPQGTAAGSGKVTMTTMMMMQLLPLLLLLLCRASGVWQPLLMHAQL